MNTEPAPFALSADGSTLAAGDGPELLVWRGDGTPAWKKFCAGILVDVAVTVDQVLAIDADGRLLRFRRSDGEELGESSLPGAPVALRVTAQGVVGVLTRDTLVLISASGEQVLPASGATAFAFGPDGTSLGVGRSDGSFTAIEVQSGAPWGTVSLPGPVAGVEWSSLGQWIVGVDRMVYRIRGDGSAIDAAITGADHPIQGLSVSQSGLVVAARAGEHVELYELYRNAPLGEFVLRRRIGAVCFGPGLHLAVGLDDGDGNVIELGTGATWRTEPHPGRGRNTWRLENKVDLAAVRGAIALHQAGGQPIARYVPPPQAQEPQSGGSGCLAGCLAVFSLVGVISLICAGVLLFTYLWRAWGMWELMPIR
jgi:hypothetical protein